MATKASKGTWTDFAILESSKGGKQWKVQRNADGDWRCHCPSYIFSGKGGAVRTCKHIRHCQTLADVAPATPIAGEWPTTALKPHWSELKPHWSEMPVTATIDPVVPPLMADAKQIFAAMVAAAQIKAKHNLLDHIGRDTCQHMTEALRLRLVSFNPEAAAVATRMTARAATAATTVGVRHIQFDDD